MNNLFFDINTTDYIQLNKYSIAPFISACLIFIFIIQYNIYFFIKKDKIPINAFLVLLSMFFYILGYGMYSSLTETGSVVLWVRITYTAIVLNALSLIYSLEYVTKKKNFLLKLLFSVLASLLIMLVWFSQYIITNKVIYDFHPTTENGQYFSILLIYVFFMAVIVTIKLSKEFIYNKSIRSTTWPLLIGIIFWVLYNMYVAYVGKILNGLPNISFGVVFVVLCLAIYFILRIKKDSEELMKSIEEKDRIYNKLIKDVLTGVYARNYVLEIIDNEISILQESSNNISLIFMDIDKFKDINDEYGHIMGDNIVRGFGDILNKSLEGKDIAGRYGGDEFIVLIYELSEEKVIEILCDIIDKFEKLLNKYDINDNFEAGLSMGVINSEYWCHNLSNVIEKSDKAMYFSKMQGSNRISIYKNVNGKEKITTIKAV